MAEQTITLDRLRAYTKLPLPEQRNSEINLLGHRLRLIQTAKVPILKEMEGIFGKEVLIVDRLTVTEEADRKLAGQPSMQYTQATMDSTSDEWAGTPLRFEFFNLSKVMKGADWSARSRYRIFTATDYFPCNPLNGAEALNLRQHLVKKPALVDFPYNNYHAILLSDSKDIFSTAFISIGQDKTSDVTSVCKLFGKYDERVQQQLIAATHRFKALHVTTKATAVYNFLTAPAPDRRFIGSYPSEMTMAFSWLTETPTAYLTPPSTTSKVIVRCSPGWKDPRVSLFEETCILEHLLCMAQTLREGIPMVWPKSEDKNEAVIPRVKTLIQQSSLSQQDPMTPRFCDFTEQLFDVLAVATTNETLVEALQIVFAALRAAEIKTIVHTDNKSTMARMIRDSLNGDLNLPRLEAMTPIQLLLEIGIERFRRNMIHTFVQEKLVVSAEEFNLQYWQTGGTAEENALKLLPLHLALVTILELSKYLNMSEHGLSNLRRKVLCDYTAKSVENITNMFTFETSVLFSEINLKVLKCVKPSLWFCESSYSSRTTTAARTITHFTKEMNMQHLEDVVNAMSRAAEDNGIETDETTPHPPQYICSLLTASYNRKDLNIIN